jgi:DNA-binding winged helix-turn-helix (wHTH) protein
MKHHSSRQDALLAQPERLTISIIEDNVFVHEERSDASSRFSRHRGHYSCRFTLSFDENRRWKLSPGVKKIVVMGEARVAEGPRHASANDALVPLIMILASSRDAEGTLRELALRIEDLLGDHSVPIAQGPRRKLMTVGELVIDEDAHRVTVGGEEVSLTGLEFKLLVALTERRERVYARTELLSDVWGSNVLNRTRTVDTHVKRLRDKLKSAGRFIETVRGVGYRFSEAPSARPVEQQPVRRDYDRPASHFVPILRRA